MKIVLLVEGGRSTPPALKAACERAGLHVRPIALREGQWNELLPDAYAVLLILPSRSNGTYLNSLVLWQRYLMEQHANLRLLTTGYEALDHRNHLDLLQLENHPADWWNRTLPLHSVEEYPVFTGIDLSEKLKRFFDGHGDESVVAVLSRIRLVVQMAGRELQKMGTPYEEVYTDLVAPAQLADKWREWRNRWINYYPLFEHTPLAGRLEQIAQLTADIEPWMLADGKDKEPIAKGTVLRVLNEMRERLQHIEKRYVVQKLSPAHR